MQQRQHSRGTPFSFDRGTGRIRALFFLCAIAALFVWIRLFFLMIIQHDWYARLASSFQDVATTLVPKRGRVFIQDSRSKEEYPLAMNRDYFLLYADTRQIPDDATAEDVAEKLSAALAYSDEKKLSLFLQLNKRNDPYEPITQKLDEEAIQKIQSLSLPGIAFVRKPYRYYPEGELASSVIGFLGKDEAGSDIGRYGIEGYWNKELSGSGGFFEGARSAGGRWIPLAGRLFQPPSDGADLLLTIDRTIQFEACRRLQKGLEEYGASSAALIIMDPASGKIRAMCSLPTFDPNMYQEAADASFYNNTAIFTPYEPGSIFKPVTMSIALHEGLVSPSTVFTDTGSRDAGCKKQIQNAGQKAYGSQTMAGVLENSINTGMVFVADKLGKRRFREYAEKFGFGVTQGIMLDTESAGTIDSLSEGSKDGLDCYSATASFGQGITVTPLQMAAAISAIANGGVMMEPSIVEEIRRSDGNIESRAPKEIRRVISARAASLLSGMMVGVVDHGHAKQAGVQGYYVAGKTGTAQIPGPGGYTDETIHSFVGFAPVDDPKFIMIVKYEKPRRAYAESTAAPVFGDIAKFLLSYYQVPPSR